MGSERRIYLASNREVWCLPGHDGAMRCVFGPESPWRAPDEPPVLDWATIASDAPVGVVAGVGEPPAEGAVRLRMRPLFDSVPPGDYAVAAEAVPVAEWRRTSRFCGVCAESLVRDAAERCMVCPRCANRVYPRINPAVITCITRGGEVLLARRATPPNDYFSIIAGFVEVGENLEHAVRREVREEVGIAIRDLRYIESQSWPFPNGLMLAFRSEYAEGEVRADGVEIAEAGWFRPDALPPLPGRISVARRMIDSWLATRA